MGNSTNPGKSGKKTVWLYAVILFTSAFIVLLLTAYSQIKFTKNIDDYKTRISSEIEQKNNFQLNLNSALDENKKMKTELESLKAELSKNKGDADKKGKEFLDLQDKYTQTVTAYDTLVQAGAEYDKGNIVGCAMLLYRQFNVEALSTTTAKERYKFLADNTFKKASEILYNEGYRHYKNKDYDSAIKKLTAAKEISRNEYFSDDCYYLIALSHYRQGNKTLAAQTLKDMLHEYSDSNYKEDAYILLGELEK